MPKNLPESTRLAYARQLADEAKTLVPGMERLSAIAEELRADDLYRLLGFDTWDRFCTDYLGVAKSTANRWIAGQKAKSIGAGQRVAAAQNAPVVESRALNSAKPSEGVAPASETVPEPEVPIPSGQSSGGAGIQPPPRPTGEPTSPLSAPPDPPERPPSDRQLAARVVSAMQDVDPTDAGPLLTPEEATFLRQWAQRTLDAWKAVYAPPAPAEKPQRRQGTITRPDGWLPTPEELAGRAERGRRAMLKAEPARIGGKRHAEDCSCLSCKAPKVVAK